MSKKTKTKSTKNYGYYLGIIGNVLLWISLLAYFIILPMYFKNGYEMVATNKYKCFMTISKYSAILLGAFSVVYFGTWGMNKEEIRVFKPLWKIDVSMLAFIAIAFLSFITSSYKGVGAKGDYDYFFYEGPLYGTSGWFMGFMTFLILVGMYFVTSRFFVYNKKIWIPIFAVTTIIFVWGILNRYQIYPIEMEYANSSFIASLGNINWFAGFQSVLAPLMIGLYWAEDKKGLRTVFGVLSLVADAMLLLNGSDSAVLCFSVMAFALLLFSLSDEKYMMKFSETILLFALAGILIFTVDKIFPEQRNMSATLSDIFVAGASPFIIFALCLALRFYFSMCTLKKAKYPEWVKKNLAKVLGFTVLGLIVLAIILIIINTKTNGALPVIGASSLFFFDDSWGSDRGATWGCGAETFRDLPFIRKLIGAGPDCFYYALCESETASAHSYEMFENSRLTNAHSEIITLLVNVGIIGTGAFLSMCFFAIKEFMVRSKKNPYLMMFALSMISYLANNLFSFEQITNIPFFFLTIGIGAAAIVKDESLKTA